MSVFTQGNILQTFVVNNTKLAGAPSLPAAGADLLSVMADSQIVAVGKPVGLGTLNEQVIPGTNPAAGTYDYFRLVQKVLDPSGVALLNYGPIVKLTPGAITSAATRTYQAPQEQIYFVGYNGSSGSLDVSQANEFILTLAYDHDDMMWSEQKLRNSYDYYSPAPTQQGLAASMVSQINYKESLGALNGTGRMVRAEMMSDGTAAVVSDGTQTQDAIVVQDSVSVRLVDTGTTTAGDLAGCQSSAPAGTVVNIAGVKYIVQSIATVGSNTVMTLNTPYQGSSGTITGGSATPASQFCKMSAITSYGIKISGQALTFQRDFFKFNKVKFHFDLKGFGNTVYDRPGSLTASSQESRKGSGSWQEASEYESFSMGNEGALNRMVIPIPPVRGYVASGTNYNVTSIAATDYTLTSPSSSIAGNSPMRVQQFIFFPTSGDGATNRTQLNSQLSNLVGSI